MDAAGGSAAIGSDRELGLRATRSPLSPVASPRGSLFAQWRRNGELERREKGQGRRGSWAVWTGSVGPTCQRWPGETVET
jgi:hypothetical protein